MRISLGALKSLLTEANKAMHVGSRVSWSAKSGKHTDKKQVGTVIAIRRGTHLFVYHVRWDSGIEQSMRRSDLKLVGGEDQTFLNNINAIQDLKKKYEADKDPDSLSVLYDVLQQSFSPVRALGRLVEFYLSSNDIFVRWTGYSPQKSSIHVFIQKNVVHSRDLLEKLFFEFPWFQEVAAENDADVANGNDQQLNLYCSGFKVSMYCTSGFESPSIWVIEVFE